MAESPRFVELAECLERHTIQVVVADLRMPDNTLELIVRVCRSANPPPFVAWSGYADPMDIGLALCAGARRARPTARSAPSSTSR